MASVKGQSALGQNGKKSQFCQKGLASIYFAAQKQSENNIVQAEKKSLENLPIPNSPSIAETVAGQKAPKLHSCPVRTFENDELGLTSSYGRLQQSHWRKRNQTGAIR